jgi:hypothetical protein
MRAIDSKEACLVAEHRNVMISSTILDMPQHREEVKEAWLGLNTAANRWLDFKNRCNP